MDTPVRQLATSLRAATLHRHAQHVHFLAAFDRRQSPCKTRQTRRLRHDGVLPLPGFVSFAFSPPRTAVPRPTDLPVGVHRAWKVFQAGYCGEGVVGVVDSGERVVDVFLRGGAPSWRPSDDDLCVEEYA